MGLLDVALLVVAAAVGVDEVDEALEARVAAVQGGEGGILGFVTLARAAGQAAGYVGWYQQRRAPAQVALKLGDEDAYAGQVEVAEMHISVGDALQPLAQVLRLWIARHKQQRSRGRHFGLHESALPGHEAEVLHVFNANDYRVGGYLEAFPVGHKGEAALGGIHRDFMAAQSAAQGRVGVDGEAWARALAPYFGVARVGRLAGARGAAGGHYAACVV